MTIEAIHVFNAYDSNYIDIYIDIIHKYIVFFHPVHGLALAYKHPLAMQGVAALLAVAPVLMLRVSRL